MPAAQVLSGLILALLVLSQADGKKCTAGDDRKIYPGCSLISDDMSLWCDLTNFTEIPNPDDVRAYAPCIYANALYINNSCLQEVERAKLARYQALLKFDCSENLLQKLRNNTFVQSQSLEVIDVSRNNIDAVEGDAFKGLYELGELKMGQNRIQRISRVTFKPIRKLRVLQIEDNRLQEFRMEYINHLYDLQHLHLQGNQIYRWRAFPRRGVIQLAKLKIVNLNFNRLQSIKNETFEDFPALERLYLKNNMISRVAAGSFDSNTKLKTIDLRNNRIQTLPKHIFDKLCHLEELFLNGNQLRLPHPNWFVNVVRHHKETVGVDSFTSGNKWICDCAAVPYWAFLRHLGNDPRGKMLAWRSRLDIFCEQEEATGEGWLLSNASTNSQVCSREITDFAGAPIVLNKVCESSTTHVVKEQNTNERDVDHHKATLFAIVFVIAFTSTMLVFVVIILVIKCVQRTGKGETKWKKDSSRDDKLITA